MPITAKNKIDIEAVSTPFDRIAFRCSAHIVMVSGQVDDSSCMSLHGTRYRKPSAGKFDICGLVGEGEIGRSLTHSDATDRALMQAVAIACATYMGVIGDATVDLNFAWRVDRGDLVGMVVLSVTPVAGESREKSTSNTNLLAIDDLAMARAMAAIFAAIAAWADVRGW